MFPMTSSTFLVLLMVASAQAVQLEVSSSGASTGEHNDPAKKSMVRSGKASDANEAADIAQRGIQAPLHSADIGKASDANKEAEPNKKAEAAIKALSTALMRSEVKIRGSLNRSGTGSHEAEATTAPRRVYVDLGANWANTLRLFEDLGEKRFEKPWEVYAFEASPFIQPYLEKFVAWLNNEGPEPPVTVPPSGSSDHLSLLAPRYGCPKVPMDAMRQCMFKVFKVPLSQLHPDPSLNSTALIQDRLNIAKIPSTGQNRFVSVPAAAGARSGMLELGVMTAEQMIRGGAHSEDVAGTAQTSANVVDIPQWLAEHYTPADYVIVKMDVEGAEFQILEKLLSGPNACLIDVLAMECHPWAGNCPALVAKLRQHPCITVLQEGSGYEGWDHHSSPDVYFPQAPFADAAGAVLVDDAPTKYMYKAPKGEALEVIEEIVPGASKLKDVITSTTRHSQKADVSLAAGFEFQSFLTSSANPHMPQLTINDASLAVKFVRYISDAAKTQQKTLKLLDVGGNSGKSYENEIAAMVDYSSLDFVKTPPSHGTMRHSVVGNVMKHNADIADGSFQVVSAFNVFEHLVAPWKAAEEIKRLTANDGYMVIMAPFSWRYHAYPLDALRYTHTEMRYLFESLGDVKTLFVGYCQHGQTQHGHLEGHVDEPPDSDHLQQNVEVLWIGQRVHGEKFDPESLDHYDGFHAPIAPSLPAQMVST